MTSRIPPLLEPYLALPPELSLIVVTGILGAGTNWLVLRYLYSYLKPSRSPRDGLTTDLEEDPSVLLVSFLRDFAFWKDGAGRLGVDLEALSKKSRFTFVDGLGNVFLPAQNDGQDVGSMTTSTLEAVARTLNAAVDELLARNSKVILVVDQLDFLLASTGDEVSGIAIHDMLLDLREKVHATISTVAADEPLISAQITTLEKEHAAFALSLAHEAEMVQSLRLLDTGAANDVSGVIRITRGGRPMGRQIEEHEYLYHVGGDAGVRVFGRGQ